MGVKVSVIVCTYNQEDTLAIALDSILGQKVDFDYEILVADDCSQDKTREVIADYAEGFPEKVRPLLRPRNLGVAKNYYTAISEARGEYIADLAGDDQWSDPEKLSRQVRMLDSDPSIVLTHGGWRYMLSKGEYSECAWLNMPKEEQIIEGKEILPYLLNHDKEKYFIHLCTSMYRRDTALRIMEMGKYVDQQDWPCEDYQLEVYMANIGKIAWQPEPVLNYRVGHSSISSEEDYRKNVNFATSVLRLTYLLTQELKYPLTVNQKYYQNQMRYIAMNCFNSKDQNSRIKFDEAIRELEWGVSPGKTVRVVQLLTRNKFVWLISSQIWKMVRKVGKSRKK